MQRLQQSSTLIKFACQMLVLIWREKDIHTKQDGLMTLLGSMYIKLTEKEMRNGTQEG